MRKIPLYYFLRHVPSSRRLRAPFVKGFNALVVETTEIIQNRDYCMFGDPSIWHVMEYGFNLPGQRTFYVDHAYLNRFNFYRVTINARQYTSMGYDDPRRFSALNLKILPWRKDKGRDVLICPPDKIYASLIGLDVDRWLKDNIEKLQKHTERNIIIRRRDSKVSLQHDLQNSHAVVTHESNVAVDALLFGVPVFLTGESAASPMASKDLSEIEKPFYPDNRKQWLSVLANNQWTPQEISHGICRKMLLEQEENYGN